MTGVLSDDGKWMWDGSNWQPVPSEGIPKPPSEPPSNKKVKIRPIIIIARIFRVLLVLLAGFIVVYDWWIYGWSGEALFPVVTLCSLALVSYAFEWKTDTIRIANKADIEFASGNIVGAMKLYKKLGDIEKVKTCAGIIYSQQSITQETTPQAQNTLSPSSNLPGVSSPDAEPSNAESNVEASNNASKDKYSPGIKGWIEAIVRGVVRGVGGGIIGSIPLIILYYYLIYPYT